jgi:hypothetical protein
LEERLEDCRRGLKIGGEALRLEESLEDWRRGSEIGD